MGGPGVCHGNAAESRYEGGVGTSEQMEKDEQSSDVRAFPCKRIQATGQARDTFLKTPL